MEHSFMEHRWGAWDGAERYEVMHPAWEVFPVESVKLEWDWACVYGAEWGFLQGAEPVNVMLARGSGVRVSPKGRGSPSISCLDLR